MKILFICTMQLLYILQTLLDGLKLKGHVTSVFPAGAHFTISAINALRNICSWSYNYQNTAERQLACLLAVSDYRKDGATDGY